VLSLQSCTWVSSTTTLSMVLVGSGVEAFPSLFSFIYLNTSIMHNLSDPLSCTIQQLT
jgi:hypothetical protein